MEWRKEVGRFTLSAYLGKKWIWFCIDLWTMPSTDVDNMFQISIVNPLWFIGEGRRVFKK
jgi:hypothetical protein